MTPTPVPYTPFEHVVGDLKSRTDMYLTSKSLILGENQTYKTSPLMTLRAAISGQVVGRTATNASDLVDLGVNPAAGWRASAQSTSGIAEFVCPPSGRTVLVPMSGRLAGLEALRREFFITDIGIDVLKPGTARGRELLLRAFGDRITTDSEPLGLSDEQKTLWAQGRAAAIKSLTDAEEPYSEADVLAELTAWLRKEQTANSARKSEVESLLENARDESKSMHDDRLDLLPALQAELKAARIELRRAPKHDAWKLNVEKLAALRTEQQQQVALRSQLDAQFNPQINAAKMAWESAVAVFERKAPATREAVKKHLRAETLRDWLVSVTESKTDKCPLCAAQKEPGAIAKLVEFFVSRTDLRATERDTIQAEEAQASAVVNSMRLKWQEAIATKAEREQFYNTTIQSLQSRIAQTAFDIEAAVKNGDDKPVTVTDGSVDALAARVTAIEGSASRKLSIAKHRVTLRELTDRAVNLSVTLDMATRFQARAVGSLRDHVIDTVQKFMPADLRVDVNIEGKKIVWSVLGAHGRQARYGALSGREQASLLIALGCALSKSPMRIAMPDDIDLGVFDAAQICQFFRVLGAAVDNGHITQVLGAWNRPAELSHMAAEGWHVITQTKKLTVSVL
jgi:hypothetical protein